jgi:hypothetical protein
VSGLKKRKRKETPSIKTWREAKERITNSSGQVVSFQHFHILKMRNELLTTRRLTTVQIFYFKSFTANFKTGKYNTVYRIRLPVT